MLVLLPFAPATGLRIGLSERVRPGRGCHMRLDTVDFAVDPRVVARFR